jgi:hypothetical protein
MNERMAYPSAEGVDLNITLERALDDASSVLRSEAARLGAEAVAVLFSAGSQVEITYSWSRLPDCAPKQHLSSIGPVRFEALKTISGPIEAGNPLAPLLRELVSLQSQSFLLFPWRMQQRVVTVVFCFAMSAPPFIQAPDVVMEKLRLIGLATWSVKEIAGLRSQLKTVISRLAGRKLVERAKGVLQVDQGISEEGAYEHLRRLSRKRRITLAALAEEVVRGRRGRNDSAEQSTTDSELPS